MHARNLHSGRYDLPKLCEKCPTLSRFLQQNPSGEPTIDFANSAAIIALNQALLAHHYGVKHWMIPPGYLCPPIPGRADYIHHAADLLDKPDGAAVLDIGTGASCIYPILGSRIYGWKCLASDIDPISVKTAQTIVLVNSTLKNCITIIHQPDPTAYFRNILKSNQHIDLTLCNPPFHNSLEEALKGNQRKRKNLTGKKNDASLNFGGQQAELWCPGGEITFLKRMASESTHYADQVTWFTSLVSKEHALPSLEKHLKKLHTKEVRIIPMRQGQKRSRLIAWTFS